MSCLLFLFPRERERERERERRGTVAYSTLQIHYRLLPLLFPYGISSSPLIETMIGFLSLYEIQISISELRFSFWFCGFVFVCKCTEMGWYPIILVKGFLRSLRQAWLFAFKSLDLIILFKMNLN
ncbi:unnamed protein product, partial [Vitis vinifera]|uniref:Uncharacterized protein n=1 Tax=Vitis vinifera TaxID=29760 RepID=D7T443_VITVI